MASVPPAFDKFSSIYIRNNQQGLKPLRTDVEIHVSCKNLLDLDVFSKSDPMVVMYTMNNAIWKEHGKTEIIYDNLNPVFTKPFKIEYNFEEHQKLKFEVYDIDSEIKKLTNQEFIGYTEITLGSIIGEHGGKFSGKLLNRKNKQLKSILEISAEELRENKEKITFQVRGINLDKKDFFGKSDPYLVFYRSAIESKDFVAVHKTEVIKNTLNPTWKEIVLPLQTLCNGDKLRSIKVECYDWDSNGSHDFIGAFETTIDEITNKKVKKFDLINVKKVKKKKYQNSGILEIVYYNLEEQYSFLDYIFAGTEICFHVAVDFTLSNGNPLDSGSLHYRNGNQPNQYMEALQSVGKICEDYDSDKLIPAYGFGANIGGVTYHAFHLNQAQNPTCFGIQGVIDAYFHSLAILELYGPTNFSPIINLVANEASSQIGKYHILLIITDGVISDMSQTKQAIINASKLPLSVIIVGVGNADFKAMDILDSDERLLSHGGLIAERDIVQFVPFRNFSGSFAGEALAKEVLYEIPTQLMSYMTKRGLKPNSIPNIHGNQHSGTFMQHSVPPYSSTILPYPT